MRLIYVQPYTCVAACGATEYFWSQGAAAADSEQTMDAELLSSRMDSEEWRSPTPEFHSLLRALIPAAHRHHRLW